MPCYNPVGVYRADGSPSVRPCGQCIGCRLEYSRCWAVRCTHESSLYEQNCFLTLTYDEKNLPSDKSLRKKDLQKFMKRLRRKNEHKTIRFFACGEYGEKFSRPHYHICLFNYDFPDRQIFKAGKKTHYKHYWKKGHDHSVYTSDMCGEVWQKGFHTIGELTFESAAYVARYVTKKVTGEKKDLWYEGKQPEFALMSRRPGIGYGWIEKYKNDVYPKDFHTLNGNKMRPNRYYDSYCEKVDKRMFEEIKKKRRLAGENKDYESHLRQWQKELHRNSITKRLERKLHNV